MLAVHRIFQMVFGIIVSVTILYFLLTYIGGYADTQKMMQRGEILKAFADEARSVYLTGIHTNFTHFSRYDFSSCYLRANERDVPELTCSGPGFADAPMDTPAIFYPGERVYISSDSLDYGWWEFRLAEALPDIVFVFNPTENTDAVWEVMRSMVEHLPDTTDDWSVVRVGFALCSGPGISYPCYGGKACSRNDFLNNILSLEHTNVALSSCNASMRKGVRLVTFSSHCPTGRGVCITPPDEAWVGNAFLEGSGKAYVYKDPLDLVALAAGGTEKDEFGKTGGEKIYQYKNSVLMERLTLAARIISKRSQLATRGLPDEMQECRDLYEELSTALDSAALDRDYANIAQMRELNGDLAEAKDTEAQLANLGCERLEYGL